MSANAGLSDYELARLENIRRNQEVLASLNIPTRIATPSPHSLEKRKPAGAQRSPTVKRRVVTEVRVPTRKSARLRGKPPVLNKDTLAAIPTNIKQENPDRQLRKRIEDDIDLALAADVSGRGGQQRFSRLLTSIAEAGLGPKREVDEDTARNVAQLRDTFSQMRILHEDDGTVKVTPERIYCAAFHPSQQMLVAAGDRRGTLGFWDASITINSNGSSNDNYIKVKEENDDKENDSLLHRSPSSIRSSRRIKVENTVADDGDMATEEIDDQSDPVYTYTPHTATLSSLKYTADGTRLFTSGYDGTIRYLDMKSQRFMEAYYYDESELLISSIDMDPTNADVVWFSTNNGEVGRCDTRVRKRRNTDLYPLLEKKIGCISINPCSDRSHYIATSSLDRTLRIWDARNLSKNVDDIASLEAISEFTHGKSVTSGYWSSNGNQIVSTCYDDTLRIFNINSGTATPSLESPVKIRHNCQTGRWLTMLRAQWMQYERTHPTFVIGNMRHAVDMFSAMTGELIWTLTAPGILTAVPAVVATHPMQHAVVGGTSSGRMLIWSKE
ncbi:WD40-repeat-containing domain protein [Syncephalis plumigaleata]|nr:WD40-repeat-containing domain protein [Syncephalis plumigaleata]